MGYTAIETEGNVTWTKKCRKYTYIDCWNRLFSLDTYIGNAHPDWLSHGQYGFPLRSAGVIGNQFDGGDTAKGYGSVKEYFNEISYGRFEISPIEVRPLEPDERYRTGIGNEITEEDIFGNRYIIPVMLQNNKSTYSTASILNEAPTAIFSQTGFDISAFAAQGGRVFLIFAGSTDNNVGGETNGNIFCVREKLTQNTPIGGLRNVIEGISVTCHEYGHTLGWAHNVLGAYDIMNTGTDMQNCPPHPSMITKLQVGFILPEEVYNINSPTEISNLPVSILPESEKKCAVITIYGKAGYDDNYGHSEVYVIENRRMIRDNANIKFDKKLVWRRDFLQQTPINFTGGLLIYHYAFNTIYPVYGGNNNIGLISADRLLVNNFVGDGHHRDFFGVFIDGDPSIVQDLLENKSESSYDLQTGIRFTNMNETQGTMDMNFNLLYTLGSPPDYNKVFYGQNFSENLTLSGTYFVFQNPIVANLAINPGAIFECKPSAEFGATINNGSGNLYAVGTEINPIIFRGIGYSSYVTHGGGLSFNSSNNSNNETAQIQHVRFDLNDTNSIIININNSNGTKNINISNLYCNGSGRINVQQKNINNTLNIGNIEIEDYFHTLFQLENTQGAININNFNSGNKGHITFINRSATNAMNIQNINLGNSDSRLYLMSYGTTRSQLQTISNCNFSLIDLFGYWNLNLNNDLTIPQGSLLLIEQKADIIQSNDIEFTTPYKINVSGDINITGNLSINRDVFIDEAGKCKIRPFNEGILSQNFIKFSTNSDILCNGVLDADGLTDSVYMTVNGTGKWKGIIGENCSDFKLNNIKIRNAETGISLNNPLGIIDIQNSRFSDNEVHDIFINNFSQSEQLTRAVKNNIFTGNPDKLSGITLSNGVNILVENNQFDEDYSNGISLLYTVDANLISNSFNAALVTGYSPIGIYAYTSGGFYSCNSITNYTNGIRLSNSSPFLFNNDIFNNSTGIYLEYSSIPIMSPAYSPGGTLYIGGYNRIFNNLDEEIYCDNTSIFVPTSMPILDYGQNSIYDQNSDCLIELGLVGYIPTITYYLRDNYWGGGSPENRICGENIDIVFEPYLSGEPEPPGNCYPISEFSDNSSMSQQTLLLGSAVSDEYNHNSSSAISKYKDLISPNSNKQYSYLALSKIFHTVSKDINADFYLLENYYSMISALYNLDTVFSRRSSGNSTLSDVEQPSYSEAIDEYQAVIEYPLNETERFYAYIDQMRTIRLMLDTLINGFDNGPMQYNLKPLHLQNFAGIVMNNKSDIKENSYLPYVNSNNMKVDNKTDRGFISTVTVNDKNTHLTRIRKSLKLENITFEGKSNREKIKILNNILAYKLFEFSIINDIHDSRPIDRMNYQKNTKGEINNFPKVFRLYQNFPNPFNPISKIKFDIPKLSHVKITIFDILGREVTTLINEVKEPGYYERIFDGTLYSSGVYFYRFESDYFVDSKKMVLIK